MKSRGRAAAARGGRARDARVVLRGLTCCWCSQTWIAMASFGCLAHIRSRLGCLRTIQTSLGPQALNNTVSCPKVAHCFTDLHAYAKASTSRHVSRLPATCLTQTKACHRSSSHAKQADASCSLGVLEVESMESAEKRQSPVRTPMPRRPRQDTYLAFPRPV